MLATNPLIGHEIVLFDVWFVALAFPIFVEVSMVQLIVSLSGSIRVAFNVSSPRSMLTLYGYGSTYIAVGASDVLK
jgi:hypothetical protein